MNVKGISVLTGLFCLWAGACGAAQTIGPVSYTHLTLPTSDLV